MKTIKANDTIITASATASLLYDCVWQQMVDHVLCVRESRFLVLRILLPH